MQALTSPLFPLPGPACLRGIPYRLNGTILSHIMDAQHSPFEYTEGIYEDKEVIFIRFAYDNGWIEEIKQLVGARWSANRRA